MNIVSSCCAVWCRVEPRRVFLGFLFLSMFVILTTTANPVYADTTHCGDITTDQTWSDLGNVHVITYDI